MARYYLELLGIMASFTRTPYRQWKSIQMMAERRQLRDEVSRNSEVFALSPFGFACVCLRAPVPLTTCF